MLFPPTKAQLHHQNKTQNDTSPQLNTLPPAECQCRCCIACTGKKQPPSKNPTMVLSPWQWLLPRRHHDWKSVLLLKSPPGWGKCLFLLAYFCKHPHQPALHSQCNRRKELQLNLAWLLGPWWVLVSGEKRQWNKVLLWGICRNKVVKEVIAKAVQDLDYGRDIKTPEESWRSCENLPRRLEENTGALSWWVLWHNWSLLLHMWQWTPHETRKREAQKYQFPWVY